MGKLLDEAYNTKIKTAKQAEEENIKKMRARDPFYDIHNVVRNATRAAKFYSGQNTAGSASVQKPITYTDIVEQVRSTGQTAARTAQNMLQNPTPVQAVRNVFNNARKGAAMTQAGTPKKWRRRQRIF